MKKVLLLGGTGAIGNYVAKHCSSLGYKVYITSRSRRFSNLDNISFFCGDATDFSFLTSLLSADRYDAVIDFMVYETSKFIKHAEFILENTDHYVFLSSYRVFSDSGLLPLAENSPRLLDVCNDHDYLNTDEYALAKARQEDILIRNEKRNWTILRPSITYSAGRFQLGSLEANIILPRAIEGLPVILPYEMMQRYTTMTWAGDVGNMISKVLFQPQCMGTDFNATTSEALTWGNVAKIYHDTIGLNVINVSTEDFMSLGLNPYQLKYDRLINRICDNKKILMFTGIEDRALRRVADALPFELGQTKLCGLCSFTRIHGRIDRILGFNRIRQGIGSKYILNYLVGYCSTTNKLYNHSHQKRMIPTMS